MSEPSWILKLSLRPEVVFPTGERARRDEFFAWVWQEFVDSGLTGVHEGTVLSDEAHAAGLETESWVLDSAQAPHFRDWIGGQGVESPELYFVDEASALSAAQELSRIQGCQVIEVRKQEPQDWDAEWKKNFKGIDVPGFGRIVPPWETTGIASGSDSHLILNPGAGFGTGTHETTQLCLQAMSEWRSGGGSLERVLDFGSGSGILAIGAALKGAGEVHAVEIDPLAVENARENAKLNGVQKRVIYALDFEGLTDAGASGVGTGAADEPYDVVFANILRPVLIQFSQALCSRVKRGDGNGPGGCLILSGLVQEDLPQVISVYSQILGVGPTEMAKNEWRALKFQVG